MLEYPCVLTNSLLFYTQTNGLRVSVIVKRSRKIPFHSRSKSDVSHFTSTSQGQTKESLRHEIITPSTAQKPNRSSTPFFRVFRLFRGYSLPFFSASVLPLFK